MMNTASIPDPQPMSDSMTDLGKWFEEFIDRLRELQKRLEKDQSNSPERGLIETLMIGTENDIAAVGKNLAQSHFVKNIILEYVQLISKTMPLKLAFHFNDSEVLVWAEVANDDWTMEKALIMAEAQIKAKYLKYGFDMVSTFVEQSDELPVPKHYSIVKS
ncbi:MAG: hypothetical protein R3D58_13085 [Saprospiraceae bacterium]